MLALLHIRPVVRLLVVLLIDPQPVYFVTLAIHAFNFEFQYASAGSAVSGTPPRLHSATV